MSVLINSEDFESGNSGNGVWHLHRSIEGAYTVVDQLVEIGTTPWVWSSCNQIKYEIAGYTYSHHLFRDNVIADAETLTNKTVLASYLQTSFQDQADEPLDVDPTTWWTVTCTYNAVTDTFDVVFSKLTEMIWSESTCAGLFNNTQKPNETALTFNLSAANVTTTPRYLFLSVEECASSYVTDNQTTPSIVLSAQNYPLTEQKLIFLNSTDTLTMKLYLPNVSAAPVPLTIGWELLLLSSNS